MLKRVARAGVLLGLLLVVASCQRGVDVRAVFIEGRLAFVADDDRFCPHSFSITSGEREVWSIVIADNMGMCGISLSSLSYGRPPREASTYREPERLAPGVRYEIMGNGAGGAHYFGSFRIMVREGRATVENGI